MNLARLPDDDLATLGSERIHDSMGVVQVANVSRGNAHDRVISRVIRGIPAE